MEATKKLRSKSESKIQSEILHYLREQRIFAFKVIVANERGIPDIICCKDGKFITLEVKRPGQHVTAIQAAQMQRINAANGLAWVVSSVEEVMEIMK